MDLIVRHAQRAGAGAELVDIAIGDGRIAAAGPSDPGTATVEIDAHGRVVGIGAISATPATHPPGKKADIVLLDLDAVPFVPLNDHCVHLVYSEPGSSVTDVLVDGEMVLRDGALTRIDEAEMMAEIALRAPEYLAQRDRWEAIAREYEPNLKALYLHCMEQDTGLERLATTTAAGVRQP